MKEERLKGSPVSTGIAIGKAYFFVRSENRVSEFPLDSEEVEGEVAYYRSALSDSRREVKQLSGRLQKEGAVEGAAILDTHLQIMEDPALTSQIEEKIRRVHKNSAFIFQQQVTVYEERFKKIEDPFFQERVKDLQDVARRILGRLKQNPRNTLADVPTDSIVFAHELVPSETAEAHSDRILAFVTQTGGDTSHSAIMAKARGIPYVANINLQQADEVVDATVIVDGRLGEVIINPTEATLSKYRELQRELSEHYKRFEALGEYVPETIDGYRVSLYANVEMFNELDLLKRYGADGIGLFRSEYLCLTRTAFPSEEEQYHIYKQIAEEMGDEPVTIRTFDVGGDKLPHLHNIGGEDNPFLGCRAIRFMLKEHEAFKSQLRAILRASAHGNLRILFPMVSGLAELREAKAYVHDVQAELRQAGVPFDKKIEIGCMIEVPSAAITCDLLARECDFLSIGTNDLVQYALAVDRSNHAMNYLYTPAHPSVIRLIKMVVTEANRNSIPVTLCGEVAADPRFVPLLLGLGVNGLSVASRYLPIVKNAIRHTNIVRASRIAERALSLQTPIEVLELLIREYQSTIGSSESTR